MTGVGGALLFVLFTRASHYTDRTTRYHVCIDGVRVGHAMQPGSSFHTRLAAGPHVFVLMTDRSRKAFEAAVDVEARSSFELRPRRSTGLSGGAPLVYDCARGAYVAGHWRPVSQAEHRLRRSGPRQRAEALQTAAQAAVLRRE